MWQIVCFFFVRELRWFYIIDNVLSGSRWINIFICLQLIEIHVEPVTLLERILNECTAVNEYDGWMYMNDEE